MLQLDRYVDAAGGVDIVDSLMREDFTPGATPTTDRLEVELDVVAPWTGGTALSGSTGSAPFDDRAGGSGTTGPYTTGRLALASDDGALGIALDADAGDPGACLSAVTEGGTTSAEVRSRASLLEGCAEPPAILNVRFGLRVCADR